MIATAIAVAVPGSASAQLPLPTKDPAKVANPSSTVPVGAQAVGGVKGSASVSATGVAEYEVPLTVVPGRAGFGPNLSVKYSSQSGNGQLGMGFNLSGLSQISLCAKSVADDQVAQGVQFNGFGPFCLDGQRLIAKTGQYGANGTEYRTLPDTHVQVKSFRAAGTPSSEIGPTYFEVRRPDGRVETYGDTFSDNARARVAAGNQIVNTAWHIQWSRDRSDNEIKFEYGRRTAAASNPSEIERWIDRISYGRVGQMDRLVEFGYETRPDPRFGYSLGQPRESTKRLKSVTMSLLDGVEKKRAREYSFSYLNDGATKNSKLATLRECGVIASDCKRDTHFTWSLGSEGFAAGKAQTTPSGGSLVPPSVNSQLIAADFDADGRSDLAWPDASNWKYLLAQPTSGSQIYTTKLSGPENSLGVGATAWPLDYDGDGRVDMVRRSWPGDPSWKVLLTKLVGHGPTTLVSTPFTGGLNHNDPDAGAIPGDFDGDGYQDVIEYARQPGTNLWNRWWRRNSGTVSPGIDSATPYDTQAFSVPLDAGLSSENPASLTVADVFGDGRDQLLFGVDGQLIAKDIAKGTTVDTKLPSNVLKLDKQWLDLNNDGLTDLLTNGTASGVKEPKLYYWLNTGRGFSGAKSAGVSADGFARALVVDYDGDGTRDLLVPRPATGGQIVPLWVGLDVVRAKATAADALSFNRLATTVSFEAMPTEAFRLQGPRTVDANGDGLTDVLLVNRPSVGTSGTPTLQLFLHKTDGGVSGARHDLLWQVYEGDQNPKGPIGSLPPTVEFRYSPLTNTAVYDRGSCARATGFACQFGGGAYVVEKVLRDSGIDDHTQMVSEYFYRDGRTDRFRRQSLGFAERRVISYPSDHPDQRITERAFYDNTVRWSSPRLEERWIITPLSGGRKRLERAENDWANRTTGSGSQLFFSYPSETRQRSYEFPDVANLAVMTPSQFTVLNKKAFRAITTLVSGMDEYGNAGTTVTRRVAIDKVQENKTTLTLTPDLDVANWLVNRPKKIVEADQSVDQATGTFRPAQTRTSSYTYEGPTKRVDTLKTYGSDAAPGRQLLTSFDYSSGNVIRRTMTDLGTGDARETTYAHDGFGYLHATQNGKSQTAYTGYDPVLGVLKVAVDINGLRTDHTYDTLGRLVKTRTPSGVERTMTFTQVPVGTENLLQIEVKDGSGAVTQSVADRLGRPVTERFKARDNGMRQRLLTYDGRGRLAFDTTFHPVGTVVTEKTKYGYDNADRIVSVREPYTAAPATWSYSELTTTSTDARGNTKSSTVNQNGQVVRQVDDDGTSTPPTRTYVYGSFGTLLSTRNSAVAGSETRYEYDALGAQVTRTDGERGKTSYAYNAFGAVIGIDDANGRHAAITYDVLGRETLRSTSKNGIGTSTTTHTWDTAGGRTFRGALMQVTADERIIPKAMAVVTTDYSYDAFGRLDLVSQTLPQTASPTAPLETLSADYDFDKFGRLSTLRYPKLKGQTEGTKVQYAYGAPETTNGQLSGVTSGAATLWTADEVDTQGRLVGEESGDGVTTSRTLGWDGRVLDIKSLTSSTDIHPNKVLFGEQYTYDDQRNLESRVQGAVTERFTYDQLNRLATGKTYNSTTGAVFQTDDWHYDKLGNLSSSELRGTYTYGDPSRPTQVTKVTGGLFGTRSYGYDPVGNQTVRPDAKLTYNDRNLPVLLAPASGTATSFSYDGNGERVRSSGNRGTTTYLPGLYERQQSAAGTEHRLRVQVEGRDVATLVYQEAVGAAGVTKQPTLYPHGDHLGSTRLVTTNKSVTDSAFQAIPVETRSYDVLGKRRNPDLTRGDDQYTNGIQPRVLNQGFTSHDDDDDAGLVNMRARLYDPDLGRFTTPDAFAAGANPTQMFNRYTYVSNNALRYTDPTGRAECDAGSHCDLEVCPPEMTTCIGGTSSGDGAGGTGTPSDGDCPPGALCADEVVVVGRPEKPVGDPAPGPYHGGQPGSHEPGGPDETSGDGCGRTHTCHDIEDPDEDPDKESKKCEPLCRDGFGYKNPGSQPTQTNTVTPAGSGGNQAATDVKPDADGYVVPTRTRDTDKSMGADGVTYPSAAAAAATELANQLDAIAEGTRKNPVAGTWVSIAAATGASPAEMAEAAKAAAPLWGVARWASPMAEANGGWRPGIGISGGVFSGYSGVMQHGNTTTR
ncbi:FG-GAP-like repeat-containing protein [Kribbella sindirgiensis]|uniref:FG-GAP-like repeat-containing protein n=1 Tax=Kribbella sindirgiensis TaxID=1124744 RepID=UPI0013F492D3|nr:FG-GAP-like repeat-containing protein [Kribbella sindirgiensis]